MEARPVADEAMTVETAQAYQALCAFCSWALLADVGEEDVARLAGDRSLFLEPPFSQVAPRAAEELAGWLAQADGEGGASALAREAHLDRSYLFYMVGQSRTSPYESVYRTDDATLYGPTTFQVREAYAAHGLAFGRSANEPDDHLGLMLGFLSRLVAEEREAAEAGDEQRAVALADEQDAFLTEHVLPWLAPWRYAVEKHARTDYYRGVGAFVFGLVACYAGRFGIRFDEEACAFKRRK